jgi:DNA-binding NarL/FixJ family response regulator
VSRAVAALRIRIPALLWPCARTVHKHTQRIYAKLGVETRTAAVMRALQTR